MKNRFSFYRVIAVSLVCITVLAGIGYKAGVFQVFGAQPSGNSLLVIVPYRYAGTWVFDDRARGLSKEAFVAGIPELINKLTADIPDAEKGFRLTFSAQEFPGFEDKLVWKRNDVSGNWYYSESFQSEGWLCPALFKYFKEAPKTIYVKADPK